MEAVPGRFHCADAALDKHTLFYEGLPHPLAHCPFCFADWGQAHVLDAASTQLLDVCVAEAPSVVGVALRRISEDSNHVVDCAHHVAFVFDLCLVSAALRQQVSAAQPSKTPL